MRNIGTACHTFINYWCSKTAPCHTHVYVHDLFENCVFFNINYTTNNWSDRSHYANNVGLGYMYIDVVLNGINYMLFVWYLVYIEKSAGCHDTVTMVTHPRQYCCLMFLLLYCYNVVLLNIIYLSTIILVTYIFQQIINLAELAHRWVIALLKQWANGQSLNHFRVVSLWIIIIKIHVCMKANCYTINSMGQRSSLLDGKFITTRFIFWNFWAKVFFNP